MKRPRARSLMRRARQWLGTLRRLNRLRLRMEAQAQTVAELREADAALQRELARRVEAETEMRQEMAGRQAQLRALEAQLGSGVEDLRRTAIPEVMLEIEALQQRLDQWRLDASNAASGCGAGDGGGAADPLVAVRERAARRLFAKMQAPADGRPRYCLGWPTPAEETAQGPRGVLLADVMAPEDAGPGAAPEMQATAVLAATARLPAGAEIRVTLAFLDWPATRQVEALQGLASSTDVTLWLHEAIVQALERQWALRLPGCDCEALLQACGWRPQREATDARGRSFEPYDVAGD